MVRPVLIVIALLTGHRALAEALELSLQEALDRAVLNNQHLALSRRDLKVAEARAMEAIGAEDVVLGTSGQWLSGTQESVLPANDFEGGISLSRLLPTGGTAGLRLSSTWAPMAGDREGTRLAQPSALLTLTQPLLRGFGPTVTRGGRKRAALFVEQAFRQRDAVASEVLRATTTTYWELAFANSQLRVRRASLELAREQLRAVQAAIDVGKQPASGAAEVEVAIALREDEALQAEQFAQERAVELSQLLVQPAAEKSLVPSDPLPDIALVDTEEVLSRALDRHPTLVAAQVARELATFECEVARNGLLPQFDVSVSGGPSGRALVTTAALGELFSLRRYSAQVGLTFAFPVENSAARARFVAASEALLRSQLALEAATAQVRSAVLKAVAALHLAAKRVEVLRRATTLAKLDLEAARERFQAGRSTSFDVLRRQEESARVQIQHERARLDALKAHAQLESLSGDLLLGKNWP